MTGSKFPASLALTICFTFMILAAFGLSMARSAWAIELPKTGQVTSYHSGEDGAIQAGAAWPSPRFTDNGDGSVTDHLTGLMWVKDLNLMPHRDPGFDTDGGDDGAVTWQHALDYVAKLNQENYLGHNDWRLANVFELVSLLDASRANPVLPQGHPFENVQTLYWSSTIATNWWNQAWRVGLSDSGTGWWQEGGSIYRELVENHFFVAVVRDSGTSGTVDLPRTGQTVSQYPGDDGALQKGASGPSPRFVANGDGTVTDRLTGLMWTQNTNQGGASLTWDQALDYVAGMNTATHPNYGYTDWRLPNRVEFLSLVDYGQTGPALPKDHPFTGLEEWYSFIKWTSTTDAGDTTEAWQMRIDDGRHIAVGKTDTAQVWPCRTVGSPLSGHVIEGLITFGPSGLKGVKVTLSGPLSGVTHTDESGLYRFDYLPDGSYTVTAEKQYYGFTPPSRNVNLSGADVTGQNFAAQLTSQYGWVDMSEKVRGFTVDLHDISCVSHNECWVSASNKNQILHTTDGGETWDIQSTAYPTSSVEMTDAQNGYAAGENGRVYQTTDGGAHWTMIGAVGKPLWHVSCPPSGQTCYASGDDGTIVSIEGSTVSIMDSGVISNLHSIHFPVSSDEGWMVGESILDHFTGGAWTADQTYPYGGYNGVFMIDNQTGISVGDLGLIVRTTDGHNWTEVTNPGPGNRAYEDVFFVDDNHGWAVGDMGLIISTEDGGQSWQVVDFEMEHPALLARVQFTSLTNGYVVGNKGTLLKYTSLAPPGAMGSIGDLVFEDQDGDGQKDAGEPGIGNITVTLSGPWGPYTASTGTDGSYLFAGLVAGDYTVDVDENDQDLPAGSVLTTGNDPLNVHLGESENFLNADFGFYTGTSGTKGDVNEDGFVNIVDALLMARHAVNLPVETFNSYAAEVNCDGQIDIVDALLIARKAVNLHTPSWCE